MEMPYPVMSQVWDRQTGEYISFDKYVTSFIGKLDKNYKYLFVDTATLRGKNFTRVRQSTTARDLNVRYASVYLENDSIFTPDYFQEKFSNISDPLIFEWENSLNKNWNY